MKKPLTIALALIAVVAIVVAGVFGSQKGSLQKQLTDATAAAETTKADLEKQLADAAAAAETTKADLEKQLADATAAAETTKADLEKQLKEATDAAAKTKEDLEKQLADATAAAETAAKAKEELEKKLSDATATAETAAKDLETVTAEKTELEKQLKETTDAAAKVKEDLEKQLADANAAAETTKADLEKQTTAATTAETAKADLEKQLEEAAAAAESAKTDLEKQLADAVAAAETLKADLEAKLAKTERQLVAAKSNAYIMYANGDWSVQNWGVDDAEEGGVLVNPAAVTGEGSYTTSLEFATPAEGLAFIALGIQKGEMDFPGGTIDIKEIRVNGEAIEIKKGYTSSDDGKETRMNIYNEWVSELPSDARRADQDLTDASPIIVDKAAFASVSKVEVDFDFHPLMAYLMFANADWSIQNWGPTGAQEGVTVHPAEIAGEGNYSVSLEFAQPSEGLAFAAIGIKNGEKTYPGYIIQATDMLINENPVALTGTGYTNSDDGLETRENLYNEWVDAANLPADARNEEGLENASPIIVDKDAFTGVQVVTVNFRFVKGQAPAAAAAEAPMTEEEAKALKDAGFHAYIGVQGKDTYVFRNAWNDSYGLNDTEHPYFNRLTGWDESNNAVDYSGSFEDAAIGGNGEYTVSLTTGEMGFGTTSAFNLLFVSTDIPSKLVKDGWLTISDVKAKIGSGATQEFTSIDTEGDYVRIVVLDSYNQSAEPFGYTVPGANETISITFTVSGW